jgi:hypothetical protein
MAAISLITGLLSGAGRQGDQNGVSIDRNAFNIPDADKYRQQAGQQYDASIQRQNYIQPKQRSFVEGLEQQAAGQGPSLAAEQLKQAQNRSLAQQMAAAQAARGGNPALAQRQLAQNQMQSQATMAGQAMQGRIQEQNNARGMLQNQLNGMQTSADQGVQNYLQQGFSMAEAQQQAAADYQKLAVSQAMGLAGINSQIRQNNTQQMMQVGQNASKETSDFMSGMGKMMMSDETNKTNIKDGSQDIHNFLDALKEHSYKYKNTDQPGTSKGKRFGIMAQDLEKSKAGKSIVHNTSYGKMVDTAQGFGVAMAATANLHKRLKKLEGKKK